MKMIGSLFAEKLDIVGDIHGEHDALQALLKNLGYDAGGNHPDGRKLVFVGDLVDRGHDSPAVIETIMALVTQQQAQCVLGNHELNILREDVKIENRWFFDPDATSTVQTVSPGQRSEFLEFFAGLPVALERDDLRVVHACWNGAAIREVRDSPGEASSTMEMYNHYEQRIEATLASGDHKQLFDDEHRQFGDRIVYGSNDPATHWPDPKMLPAHAWHDEIDQMGNPLSVVTSGEERRAEKVYPAGGKFRFVDRVAWWDNYADNQAVIVGHYWRRYRPTKMVGYRESGRDLFPGFGPERWLGQSENVFCVDFSVAGRASDRTSGHLASECRLAAVRWPEATLMFDDGQELATDYGAAGSRSGG